TDSKGWVSNSALHSITISGPLYANLLPADGTAFVFGQPITATAAVGGGTSPYTVAFYADGVMIGSNGMGMGPFAQALGILSAGSHPCYAAVQDGTNGTAYSSTNTLTILPNPLVTILTSPTNGQS